jgi:hypothetical protein
LSAKVRIYTHTGVSNAYVASFAEQHGSNVVPMLKQPYIAGEVLNADTGAAVSSSPATAPANSNTRLLRIQVQPGKRVHLEVNPRGQDPRVASASSPVYEGNDQIEFGSQWTISVLEAAADA